MPEPEGLQKLIGDLENRLRRLEDHQEKQDDMIQIHEGMQVSGFKCPGCGETFNGIYFLPTTVMECPFCDTLMEQYEPEPEAA